MRRWVQGKRYDFFYRSVVEMGVGSADDLAREAVKREGASKVRRGDGRDDAGRRRRRPGRWDFLKRKGGFLLFASPAVLSQCGVAALYHWDAVEELTLYGGDFASPEAA